MLTLEADHNPANHSDVDEGKVGENDSALAWTAEEAIRQPAAVLFTPEDWWQGTFEWERETARAYGSAPKIKRVPMCSGVARRRRRAKAVAERQHVVRLVAAHR